MLLHIFSNDIYYTLNLTFFKMVVENFRKNMLRGKKKQINYTLKRKNIHVKN